MNMERTIKGVPVAEVLKKISTKREPDDYLMGKYPYFKMETYHELLDAVVGSDHYNVDIIDRHYTTISSNQEIFSIHLRITLLDDNYQEICHKDGYGAREVQYAENTGKDGGIKNIENNAALSAFKAAWQQFGIFGSRCCSDEDNKSGKPPQTPARTNTKSAEHYVLLSQGYVKEERIDRQLHKPVYKLMALHKENNSPCEVIFYPNQYAKCADLMEKFIALCATKETEVSILATKGKDINGVSQLIFKSFKTN